LITVNGYNLSCKAKPNTAQTGGSEEMEEMTSTQELRLIEWLKSQGFTSEKILECIEYINK
jgi:hypothetical protein